MRPASALAVSAALVVSLLVAGCTGGGKIAGSEAPAASPQLPESAYSARAGLPEWIDPDSGYDTTRTWKLDGGAWPVMMLLSPSQSPQALYGFEAGVFQEKLEPLGIVPELQRLDGPPRVFHALERSQWPFVYMPLAVFMDYVRSADNQGGAGGLQYVAIAGSTAGGGYTLLSKDPGITSVRDLKGKTVAFQNTNPVPGTLLTKAAANESLSIGDGEGDVHIAFGEAGEQINKYEAGEYDAIVSLNIYKAALMKTGSHAVTDFADVGYRANYTILCVERSVLEQRPEVVKAFLEAHHAGDGLAAKPWADGSAVPKLYESWNDFFAGQDTDWSSQRPVESPEAYAIMLGNMQPDIRLDRDLVQACFDFNTTHKTWGWEGTVDASRLVDYEAFNAVLASEGVAPQ